VRIGGQQKRVGKSEFSLDMSCKLSFIMAILMYPQYISTEWQVEEYGVDSHIGTGR
jgi:hypothetical protein